MAASVLLVDDHELIRQGLRRAFERTDDFTVVAEAASVAEAVAATLDADTRPWTRRATRLTGAIAAGLFIGVGGLALIRNTLSDNTIGDIGVTTGIAAVAGVLALLIARMVSRHPIAGLTHNLVATAFAALAGVTALPGAPGAPNVLLAAMAAAVASVLAIRLSNRGVVALTAVSCFAMIAAGAAFAKDFHAWPARARCFQTRP